MAQFPNTTNADGIWTLKKVRRAILGDNWPTSTGIGQIGQNSIYGNLTYGNFIAFNEVASPDIYKTVDASDGTLIDTIEINSNTSYGTVSVLDNVFFIGGSYLEILTFDNSGNLTSRDQRTSLPNTSYTPDFNSEFLYFIDNQELKKVKYKETSSPILVFSDASYPLLNNHETFIDGNANIYVSTTDNRICKINTSSESLVWVSGSIGNVNKPFCVDFEGDVIVLGSSEVTVIDKDDGSVKNSFSVVGNQGISIDSQNNIVVADNGVNAEKYTKTGQVIWSYSSNLINCYSILIDFNDDIYIVGNNGQEKVSENGNNIWINNIGGNLSTQAASAPFALQMRHYSAVFG